MSLFTSQGNVVKVFATNSNPELAEEIAVNLGVKLGDALIDRFSDGETQVCLKETVRGCDVFIISATCPPVNENLMELLLTIDACKRASAGRIFPIISYYGYARQDRKSKYREPIAAKLVANMLVAAGADAILTVDLHARQIQAFFDIPVDDLRAGSTIAEHYSERHFQGPDLVIVSPDLGGVSRARNLAAKLDAPIAMIDKRRPKPNQSEVMNIIGEVKGKRAIIIDDIIDTGGTFINAANALIEAGAKEVFGCATHGVLSGNCLEKLRESPIVELLITNSIPLPEEKKDPKIRVISIAELLSRGISSIRLEESMSNIT